MNPELEGDEGSGPFSAQDRRRRVADDSIAPSRWHGRRALRAFRRHDRVSPAGSGRILRHGHTEFARCRRVERDASSARRDDVVEAILLLRRRSLARAARLSPFKQDRRVASRNEHWHHMYNAHIISMPDKWEYPWYAAWDLAFHVLGAVVGRSGLRQAATRSDAAHATTSIRAGKFRHMSGISATPIRRFMRGRPSSPTRWRRRRRAPETWSGSRAHSPNCCSISPGG